MGGQVEVYGPGAGDEVRPETRRVEEVGCAPGMCWNL